MAGPPATNRVAYLTDATPMTGEKKKRAAPVDKSERADQDNMIPEPRAKKICVGTEKYNPKYMAKMCFSAYALRLHEAALPAHTEDVAEDFRQDLLDMFTYAHTKGNFKQGTAARHMIPRLAGNPNSTRAEKDMLVKDFAEHYSGVRKDVDTIEALYNSGKSVNDTFIATMRSHVVGLHRSLADGTKWRDIVPYTPLPMECLTWLSWSIAGCKPYQLLGDLISYIEDVKNWLTIPPPKMELRPHIRASMKETLSKKIGLDTQEKAEKRAGPSSKPHPDAEAVASLKEKIEEQISQQVKKEKDLERRERELRIEATRLDLQNKKLQEQEKHSQEALQQAEVKAEEAKQEAKVLIDAAAKQSAEKIARQQKYVAVAVEREEAYKSQITLNAKEIAELKAALSEAKAQIVVHEARVVVPPPDVSTSSRSNNTTTSTRIFQPQSSQNPFIKTTGSHLNGYYQPFLIIDKSNVPESPPLLMEDVRNLPVEAAQSPKLGTTGVPRPGVWSQGQPIIFAPTQPVAFGQSAQNVFTLLNEESESNEEFREACRAWKSGRCTRGKKCKQPHEPCKKWMKDACQFGGYCNHSHDPFFKLAIVVSQQVEQLEKMKIDSSPPPLSRPWTPAATPFTKPSEPKGILKPSLSKREKSLLEKIRENAREGRAYKQNNHNQSAGPSVSFQEPQRPNPRQRQACRKFLQGKCRNSEKDCVYAHRPCKFFLKNSCKHGNKCKDSHDPAFLNTQYQTQRSAHPLSQSPLTPSSFGNVAFSNASRPQAKSLPKFDVERSLDDLISLATPKIRKAEKTPVSQALCKFATTRNGCNKPNCKFSHGARPRGKQQAQTSGRVVKLMDDSSPYSDEEGRELML